LLNRERAAAGLSELNRKRMYRLMATERIAAIHRKTAHDGQIITIRPNLRWTSDGFEIPCWDGQAVRVAFALDTCDREVMAWCASTGGISGEMIRDLMLEAVEKRFGAATTLYFLTCHRVTPVTRERKRFMKAQAAQSRRKVPRCVGQGRASAIAACSTVTRVHNGLDMTNKNTSVQVFISLVTLALIATMAHADDAQEHAICDKFSELVLATAQEREAGDSKEKLLQIERQLERETAIDHKPTQAEKIASALSLKAIDLVYRHPDMTAASLAAEVRLKCSVSKDWDVEVRGL